MSRTTGTIPLDDALELLASAHRRQILRYLLEDADPPVSLYALADQLADQEDWDVELLESQLSHNHLPRLADADIIEYDSQSRKLRLTDAAEELRPLLETCEEWEATGD